MNFAIKRYIRIECLRNSILAKSNIKLFVEFISGNLSGKLSGMVHFFQPRQKA